MLISEIIDQLEKLKDDLGDLEVLFEIEREWGTDFIRVTHAGACEETLNGTRQRFGLLIAEGEKSIYGS